MEYWLSLEDDTPDGLPPDDPDDDPPDEMAARSKYTARMKTLLHKPFADW